MSSRGLGPLPDSPMDWLAMLQVPPSPAAMGMSPLGSIEKINSFEAGGAGGGGKRSTRSNVNPAPLSSLPLPSSTRSQGPASSSGRPQQLKAQPQQQPAAAPMSTRSRAAGAPVPALPSTRPSPSSAGIISMFSGLSESHKALLSKLLAQGGAATGAGAGAAVRGLNTGRLTRTSSRNKEGGQAPTPTALGPAAAAATAAASLGNGGRGVEGARPPPLSTRGGGGGRGGGTVAASPVGGLQLGDSYDVLITPTIPNEELDMLLEFLKG